jgi:hypothetical protein
VGVLTNSPTMGANVGVQSPESNELKREGKRKLKQLKVGCTESDANNYIHPPPHKRVARVGLFIGGAQRSYYNTLNTPNYLPNQ